MSTPLHASDLLPVLIVPGIMSSGLEVQKSAVNEKHIGERVWLNPIALGFGKMYRGEAFHTKEDSNEEDGDEESDDDDDDDDDDEDSVDDTDTNTTKGMTRIVRLEAKRNILATSMANTVRKPDEQKELECKSYWLQHLVLTSDMCTEREGNEIRAIPGLDGVDFLTDIATIKVGASYVFGPIIKLLCSYGYVKGVNLDAVPYDWRIPPSILESRDGYFTQTMERIEKMYADSGCKPVVLMCHSMGCKTGHYLLNFALNKKGRDWIDTHIHTYMPLGAPHIGAPSVIGNSFAASLNEMLDPMMSHEERLVFARSLGSVGWLLPTHLPSDERNAPPTIICRKEGLLSVEILTSPEEPLDMRNLVTNKYGTRKLNPFKMMVSYGSAKKKSSVAQEVTLNNNQEGNSDQAQYYDIPPAKFLFPTPASLENNQSLKPVQFNVKELGDIRAYQLEEKSKVLTGLRYIDRSRGIALLVHEASKAVGKYRVNVGMSVPLEINVPDLLKAGETGLLLEVPLVARVDMSLIKKVPKLGHRSVKMKIRVKWIPPPFNENDDLTNPIAVLSPNDNEETQRFAPIPAIVSTTDDRGQNPNDYIPLSGQTLLRAEGLEDTFVKLAREIYGKDPVGPRNRSSSGKPPVKRIFAIYGVNLDTEVSKVCRRVESYVEDETPQEKHARRRFKVDTKTSLNVEEHLDDSMDSAAIKNSGHRLDSGNLFEHAGTPQRNLLTGEQIQRSGDGTVPYYSLQQSQVWAKEVADNHSITSDKVKIEELEGAEHRAMLSDTRFHKMLVDYLTGQTVL